MAVASKSSMRAMVPHVEASDENFQEGLDLADANDETLRKTIESRHGHGTKDRAPSSPSVSMHPAPQTIPLNDIATKESAAKSQPGFGKLFTRPASAGTPLDTGFAYAVAQKPKLDLVGGNRKGPAARQETSGDHKNVTEMKSSEGQTSKPEQSNATDGESHDRDVQDQHHGERAFKADGEASVIAEKTLDGPEEPLGPSGFPDEEEQDQKETSSTRAEAGTDYNPKEAPEELAPPQQPEEATKPDGVKSGHGAQSMLSCDVSLNKARPNAPAAGEEQADMEEMSDQLDNALESGFFDAEDGTTLIQHDSPHSEHRQTEVIGGMERQGKHRSRSSASPSSRSRQHTPEVRRPTQLPTNTSLLHEVAQSHGASKVEKTSKRKRAACDTSKPKLKTTSLLCALVDSFEADAKQRDEQAGMVKKQQKALSEKAELIGYYEQQLSYAYDRMQALGKQQDKIEHLKLQQQDTQRILHSEEAANVKLSERISKYKQLKHANVQELERLSQELQESRANRRNVQEEKEKLAADVKQKEQKLQHEKDITQKLSRDLAEAKQVAHGQWNDLLSSTESKIEGHIRRMQETIEKQPKFDPGKLNNIIGIVQQISSRPLDIGPALEKIDAVAGSVTTLGESLSTRFEALQRKQDTFITSDMVETLMTKALADLKADMKSCEDLSQQLAQLHHENALLRQGSESLTHNASQLQARQDELQAALDGMRAKLAFAERDLQLAEAQASEAQPLKDKIQASDAELSTLRIAKEYLQSRVDEQKAQEATRTGEIKTLQDGNYELKLKLQRQRDETKTQQEAMARQSEESVRTARSEHQQAQKLSEERREQQHQRDLEQKVEQVKALADRVGTLQRELDSSRKTISSKEGEQAEVRESRQRELDQTIKRAEAGERAREEALKTYELFASAQEKDKQELNAEIAALKRQMEELDAQGKARLSEEQRRTDQLEATIQLQRDELEKSQRQVLQQQQESQVSAKARSVAASGSPSGQRMARGRPEDPHNVTSRVKQSESQQSTRVSHNALPQMPNAATPSRRDVVEDDATQKPPAKPRRKANRSASAANSNVRREPSYTEVEDSQPRRTASQLSRASTLPSRGNAQDPMLLDESERAIDTRGGGASSQVPETQLNGPRSLTEITESMSPLYHRNLRSASRDLRSASLDLTDEETLVKDAEAQNSRAKSSLPKTPVVPNSSSKVSQPHPPSRNASFNNEHLPSPGAAHHLKDSLAAQQSQTRRSIAWGPRKPDITRTQTAASTADTAPSQGFRKPSVPASKTKRKASVQSESDRSTNSNKRIKTVVADNVSDPLQPSASHHFTPKKSHAKVSQHLQPSLPASKRPKIGDAGVSPMKMARKQSTGVLRPVSSRRTRAPLPTRDDMEQLFQTTIHENQPRKR